MAEEPQALNAYCQVPIKKVPLRQTRELTSHFTIWPFRSEPDSHAWMNTWIVLFFFLTLLEYTRVLPFPANAVSFGRKPRRLDWACGRHGSPLGYAVNTSEWTNEPILIQLQLPDSHVLFHITEHLVPTHASHSRGISLHLTETAITVPRQNKSQRTDCWAPEPWFSLDYLLLLKIKD